MDVNPDTLVAALGASGVTAVLGAVVTGLFSRRKLGADATKIITDAASSVVQRLETQLREADRKAEQRERQHDEERSAWRAVLQLHVAWDLIAIQKWNGQHPDDPLPPAPPVYPPNS